MQFKQKNAVTQSVNPGTYGSQTQVPVVTVDAFGRVKSITVANLNLKALANLPGDPNVFFNGIGGFSSVQDGSDDAKKLAWLNI